MLDGREKCFLNQALLYYFKGYGNLSTKNYREAASALEQAKKLSAANPGLVHDINSMLGDAYNGSKDYAKSDQAFEAALAVVAARAAAMTARPASVARSDARRLR